MRRVVIPTNCPLQTIDSFVRFYVDCGYRKFNLKNMVTNFKEIENSALKLNQKQRAELAKRLLLSLEDQIDENIEQALIDEINRRKQHVESGQVTTIPAEQVLEKARNILKK